MRWRFWFCKSSIPFWISFHGTKVAFSGLINLTKLSRSAAKLRGSQDRRRPVEIGRNVPPSDARTKESGKTNPSWSALTRIHGLCYQGRIHANRFGSCKINAYSGHSSSCLEDQGSNRAPFSSSRFWHFRLVRSLQPRWH